MTTPLLSGVSTWPRHELVRIAPEAWASAVASVIDPPSLLLRWASAEWPAIVRRPSPGERSGMVPIGVPLPPQNGKRRFALTLPERAILTRSSPPSLNAVAGAAHVGWEPTISALLALGETHGVEPSAFGSLLWQYLTGLPYLSPNSDIDTLWSVGVGVDIYALLGSIAAVAQTAPMRIDGEVLFRDGSAVNWRELHDALCRNAAADLLVKSMDGVRLLSVSQLLASHEAT
jgi:phosphoribosyl-dephospho-CoA transferase